MVAFPCVLATVLVSVVIRNIETTKASDGLILQKQKKNFGVVPTTSNCGTTNVSDIVTQLS